MTEKEFLAELPKLVGAAIFGDCMIRFNCGMDCPMTRLAKQKGGFNSELTADHFREAAICLGIDLQLRDDIMLAADRNGDSLNARRFHLRCAMLKALGLEESHHDK